MSEIESKHPYELLPAFAQARVDEAVHGVVLCLPECFRGGWFENRVRWQISYSIAMVLRDQSRTPKP